MAGRVTRRREESKTLKIFPDKGRNYKPRDPNDVKGN